MPVNCASNEESCCVAVVCSLRAVQMVCCNALVWTDEREEQKVLVTRSDPVAGNTVVTEETAMQRMLLTGTAAGKRYMERMWWTKLWQAMPCVEKCKSRDTARGLGRWLPSASSRRISVRRRP